MGEIRVFEFRRYSRNLLPFYYAPKDRDSSYFGLILPKRCLASNFAFFLYLGLFGSQIMHFCCIQGCLGAKYCIFAVLGAV